jgi:HAMP domain-containing protein
MGLRARFNLILSVVFFLGLATAGSVSYVLLERNAHEEVLASANLIIEVAHRVRAYTTAEVGPALRKGDTTSFLPQSVPAYAATQSLTGLSEDYREFAYKEATLNPTNPRDRAVDWETDLVQEFRRNSDLTVLSGERDTPLGVSMYLAKPLRITSESCLTCHSTPAAAPAAMLAVYGSSNGFGWQLGEVVGAQIVSVPASVPNQRAQRAFVLFMASLCGTFLFSFLVLNVLLTRLINRPILHLSHAADAVSTGDFTVPEFPEGRSDEIGRLGVSFNRMRRSLEEAMRMIKG